MLDNTALKCKTWNFVQERYIGVTDIENLSKSLFMLVNSLGTIID